MIVTNARNEYDDSLLAVVDAADDSSDRTTPLGQFTALAQLLDDTANNLSDSYEVAIDGGRFKDAARKEQFRGLLQRSLVEYAQIVMALDELTRSMQKGWRVKVDTKNKVPLLEVSWKRSGSGPRALENLDEGEVPRMDSAKEDDDDESPVGSFRSGGALVVTEKHQRVQSLPSQKAFSLYPNQKACRMEYGHDCRRPRSWRRFETGSTFHGERPKRSRTGISIDFMLTTMQTNGRP